MTNATRRILDGILSGDRASLARGITLVESSLPAHRQQASFLLDAVIQARQPSHFLTPRLGFAGPPGSGKSSLIEALGLYLAQVHGAHVAVLAVDPSSCRTGGSILGDRTRMPLLSHHPNAYVRASPSRGVLGGICAGTSDAITLVEGAGFTITLVETVGLGQSEVAVDSVVDMLLLVVPPAGGDELQGVKKGIVEVADAVLVNKADGPLLPAARGAAAEYTRALQLVRPKWNDLVPPPDHDEMAKEGGRSRTGSVRGQEMVPHPSSPFSSTVVPWRPPVLLCSALEGATGDGKGGIAALWEEISRFWASITRKTGEEGEAAAEQLLLHHQRRRSRQREVGEQGQGKKQDGDITKSIINSSGTFAQPPSPLSSSTMTARSAAATAARLAPPPFPLDKSPAAPAEAPASKSSDGAISDGALFSTGSIGGASISSRDPLLPPPSLSHSSPSPTSTPIASTSLSSPAFTLTSSPSDASSPATRKREKQSIAIMWADIDAILHEAVRRDPLVAVLVDMEKAKLADVKTTPRAAARAIAKAFLEPPLHTEG